MHKLRNFFKVKNLLKWPALIVSTIAFFVFLITLATVCVSPYSESEYRYISTAGDEAYILEIELDDDGKAELKQTYIIKSDKEEAESEVSYKVIKGKLFFSNSLQTTTYELVGTINAFEIDAGDWKAVNKEAKALKVCSIVFMCLFGACALASGIYTLSGKSKTKKNEKEPKIEEPKNETPAEETVNQ